LPHHVESELRQVIVAEHGAVNDLSAMRAQFRLSSLPS